MAPRSFLLILAAGAAQAAIWPEQLGEARRVASQPVTLTDTKLWGEYGLQEAEQAGYESAGGKFTATAWRLQDATSAMAAFQWQRPQGAAPSKLSKLAVETATGALLAYGNYLLEFDGRVPRAEEIAQLAERLPRLQQSPLPALPDYLPVENVVAASHRYVQGPVALERFEPRIPPSAAGFHLGAEAGVATYRTVNGEIRLSLFNYPTPSIARDRQAELQKLPGAMVKRSGPLVAVLFSPPNADDAERLLAQVRYQADITLSERLPTRRDNIGNLIVNIFVLIGILLGFALVAGVAVGGVRTALRLTKGDPEPMIRLHLSDR